MAVMTLSSRHARAIGYKAQMSEAGVWLALGRSVSSWEDELTPPVPDLFATDIDEILGFKAVDNITFVRPNPGGHIFYLGDYYEPISDSQAGLDLSTLLYVRFVIPVNFMVGTYRQVGIYRGLIPDIPVGDGPPYSLLSPQQILSRGSLDIYDNFSPTTRNNHQQDEYSFMLQF